jgi:hypothetical protein
MNLRGKENDSSPGSQDCDLVLCGIGGDLYEVKQTGHISCSLLSTYPRAYDYDPLHERMFRCWMSTSSRPAGGLTKNGHAELSDPWNIHQLGPLFSQSKLKKKLAPELEDASCNFVKIISYASGKKIGLWDFGAACCRSHKHGPSSDFYK